MSAVGEALARHLRVASVLPASVDADLLGEALAQTVAAVHFPPHSGLTGKTFVVSGHPTYAGHRITTEYVSPGERVMVHSESYVDGIRVAYTHREKDGSSLSIDVGTLMTLEEAQDRPAVPQFTINVLKLRTTERDVARRKVENIEQLVSDAQCNAMSVINVSALIEALRS